MSHTPADDPTAGATTDPAPATSRRGAIQLAAAAAAGVVGASALGTRAAAANGNPVLLGETNVETLPTRSRTDEP